LNRLNLSIPKTDSDPSEYLALYGFPTSEDRLVADLNIHSFTIMSNYRVFLSSSQGLPQNHHSTFVELKNDGSGCIYHVKGDIQNGMYYESKPPSSPLSSGSFDARKQIG
jgi:hypothetical protein